MLMARPNDSDSSLRLLGEAAAAAAAAAAADGGDSSSRMTIVLARRATSAAPAAGAAGTWWPSVAFQSWADAAAAGVDLPPIARPSPTRAESVVLDLAKLSSKAVDAWSVVGAADTKPFSAECFSLADIQSLGMLDGRGFAAWRTVRCVPSSLAPPRSPPPLPQALDLARQLVAADDASVSPRQLVDQHGEQQAAAAAAHRAEDEQAAAAARRAEAELAAAAAHLPEDAWTAAADSLARAGKPWSRSEDVLLIRLREEFVTGAGRGAESWISFLERRVPGRTGVAAAGQYGKALQAERVAAHNATATDPYARSYDSKKRPPLGPAALENGSSERSYYDADPVKKRKGSSSFCVGDVVSCVFAESGKDVRSFGQVCRLFVEGGCVVTSSLVVRWPEGTESTVPTRLCRRESASRKGSARVPERPRKPPAGGAFWVRTNAEGVMVSWGGVRPSAEK